MVAACAVDACAVEDVVDDEDDDDDDDDVVVVIVDVETSVVSGKSSILSLMHLCKSVFSIDFSFLAVKVVFLKTALQSELFIFVIYIRLTTKT